MKTAIEVSDLTVAYRHPVLWDIDLAVPSGVLMAIVGPNGAGKTTLIKAILGLVKAALERVEAREVMRVRVHPEDARILETCFADLGLPERIEVAAEQNLERGAVVLETQRGYLDASVETQLQEIERGFADLIRRPS